MRCAAHCGAPARTAPLLIAITLAVSTACASRPVAFADLPPPPTEVLSDANIAGVLLAANDMLIAEARLALDRATGGAVLGLADRILADHNASGFWASHVLRRHSITAGISEPRRRIEENAEAALRSLEAYSGPAFDRAYVRRQAELHEWLLRMLDDPLIPGARNSELRDVLRGMRPVVEEHLRHARSIVASFTQAGT